MLQRSHRSLAAPAGPEASEAATPPRSRIACCHAFSRSAGSAILSYLRTSGQTRGTGRSHRPCSATRGLRRRSQAVSALAPQSPSTGCIARMTNEFKPARRTDARRAGAGVLLSSGATRASVVSRSTQLPNSAAVSPNLRRDVSVARAIPTLSFGGHHASRSGDCIGISSSGGATTAHSRSVGAELSRSRSHDASA